MIVRDGRLDQLPVEISVEDETRRAVVDLMRGGGPTTVLGLLMSRMTEEQTPGRVPDKAKLSIEAISGLLNKDIPEVEATVHMLQEEDLCATLKEDGFTMAFAYALYTPKNGTPREDLLTWAGTPQPA